MLRLGVCEKILVVCEAVTAVLILASGVNLEVDTAKTDGPYAVPGFMDTSTIRAPSRAFVKTHDISASQNENSRYLKWFVNTSLVNYII